MLNASGVSTAALLPVVPSVIPTTHKVNFNALFCGLFYEAVSILYRRMSEERRVMNFGGFGEKRSWHIWDTISAFPSTN
jgi:hypothetical protein